MRQNHVRVSRAEWLHDFTMIGRCQAWAETFHSTAGEVSGADRLDCRLDCAVTFCGWFELTAHLETKNGVPESISNVKVLHELGNLWVVQEWKQSLVAFEFRITTTSSHCVDIRCLQCDRFLLLLLFKGDPLLWFCCCCFGATQI